MIHLIQLKTATSRALITLALVCFALLPKVQAVSPPPDGGYPGGNTAEGQAALLSLTTGGFNTAVGFLSLRSNTTSGFNTAIGAGTLLANTADQNTAIGAGALLSSALGDTNTANGVFALASNVSGSGNTASGVNALLNNFSGNANTAVGKGALGSSDSNSNTALGFEAGLGVTTAANVICIGANVVGANVDNSCYIGNIFGATSSGGTGVFINSGGKLGTMTSSRRFKDGIKPVESASEVLFALKPVTFRYKKEIDPAGTSQFGLVAEEVEKVDPDLVVRDKDGKPYSVRYDQVNAMLLNEFLKEHRTVLELKKEIAALTATVKEQAAQTQKLCAQMEMSKSRPQVAVNNR